MDAAAEFGALGEAAVFLDYFKGLPDPRQAGKVRYPRTGILLLALLAELADAESFTGIARFGDPHGLGFRRQATSRPRAGEGEREVEGDRRHPRIARHDGDPGRRRHHRRHGLPAPHRRKDHGKKADCILALQGNQGRPREEVELFATERKTRGFADAAAGTRQTVDADHGRIETRNYTVIHDVGWQRERHEWPGLKGLLTVESQREFDGKIERKTRFYIISPTLEARLPGPMIRDRWAVENGLHWSMDMTFRDDECRIRTEHAPANFTTLRHMAHNLHCKAPAKDSIRLRRKTAAWDDEFLVSLIAA